MANMFSSRKGPMLIAAGLFGGILYYTVGGKQQPRTRAVADAGSSASVSERLQSAAGTGGQRARDSQEHVARDLGGQDVKDARLGTSDTDSPSKREPGKVRSGKLGD